MAYGDSEGPAASERLSWEQVRALFSVAVALFASVPCRAVPRAEYRQTCLQGSILRARALFLPIEENLQGGRTSRLTWGLTTIPRLTRNPHF